MKGGQQIACWLLAITALKCVVCNPPTPLGPWQAGTASFFGGPAASQATAPASGYSMTIDSGSCGYGDLDPRLWPFYGVVGLHPSNSIVKERAQSGCGSCLEVECTSGSSCYPASSPIPVLITDQCIEDCNTTNINMHVFSFEQLAPLRLGRIGIRYRLVTCEPADPVTVFISNYRTTGGGWIRMAFKNVAGDGALTSVELAPAGADINAPPRALNTSSPWLGMVNTFGATWEASRLPQPPMDIRITDSVGEMVVIKNAVAVPGITGDVETTAVPELPSNRTLSSGSGSVLESGPKMPAGLVLPVTGEARTQPLQMQMAARNSNAQLEKAAAATKASGSRKMLGVV